MLSADIQAEAAWVLINVSAGSSKQASTLIEMNAVKPLSALIGSLNMGVVENAVWALSNLACEFFNIRKFFNEKHNSRIMSPILVEGKAVCDKLSALKVDTGLRLFLEATFYELDKAPLCPILDLIDRIFIGTNSDCSVRGKYNLTKCLSIILHAGNDELKQRVLKMLVFFTSKGNLSLVLEFNVILFTYTRLIINAWCLDPRTRSEIFEAGKL
jgi:hypothetical protein